MLSRSYMAPSDQKALLAYSPMFHARLFAETPKYRASCFQPTKSTLPDPGVDVSSGPLTEYDAHLDGNPAIDRPLFVQFCANDPEKLLASAKLVQAYCDAVDLNLGCPQGIAKKGNYGAFLQENQDLISKLIRTLRDGLDIPVTAKFRILETRGKTLQYAKLLLEAGASIITVHGRQRHQKGHNTGLADWSMIRYLREQLPPETVMFANGNILQHGDIAACLEATGVDGIMSAEGNLHDPTIFGVVPEVGQEGREYWRGRDGKGGFRMDAVMRRYMDIIYKYVLQQQAPQRKPLFLISDPVEEGTSTGAGIEVEAEGDEPPKKKRKKSERKTQTSDPNLTAMQAHLFQMLRPLITKHTHVRDQLARSRSGDIASFERVLAMVEQVTKEGMIEYENAPASTNGEGATEESSSSASAPSTEASLSSTTSPPKDDFRTSSKAAVERCQRPFWVCQPYIRPLPDEALAKGALAVSKKDKKRQAEVEEPVKVSEVTHDAKDEAVTNGAVEVVKDEAGKVKEELPKEGMVCG
jgi:tRNA-dihydrouridine synthase 1